MGPGAVEEILFGEAPISRNPTAGLEVLSRLDFEAFSRQMIEHHGARLSRLACEQIYESHRSAYPIDRCPDYDDFIVTPYEQPLRTWVGGVRFYASVHVRLASGDREFFDLAQEDFDSGRLVEVLRSES